MSTATEYEYTSRQQSRARKVGRICEVHVANSVTLAMALTLILVGCGKSENERGDEKASARGNSDPQRKWPSSENLTDGYWRKDRKFWDKDLAEWARLLSADEEDQRHQAALVVGCYGKAALPFVLDLLRQDEDRVGQIEAVRTAFYLGSFAKDARQELIRLLKEDRCKNIYCRFALAALHETGGIPDEFQSMANDKILWVQWQYDEEAACRATIERFLSPPANFPRKFLTGGELTKLYQHGDLVESVLVTVLQEDDVSRRVRAAELLGKIGTETARNELKKLVASESVPNSLRISAIKALGELGNPSPSTVSVLRGMLDRKSPYGPAALEALGTSSRSSREALPEIVELFRLSPNESTSRQLRIRGGYISQPSDFDRQLKEALVNYGEPAVP